MLDSAVKTTTIIIPPDGATDMRKLSEDWELMLGEAHHRMKNTLAFLAGRLRVDVSRSGSNGLHRIVDRFESRIMAFARLYQLLIGVCGDETTSVADYFEDLCGALSTAILEFAGLRCEIAIEDGMLDSTQCHRLGLIVTELVTNAAKHAFPDGGAGGVVRVVIRRREGQWHCVVADNGVGFTCAAQNDGGRILQGLLRSVGASATLKSGRDGTAATVILPC